jgi:hypothetical protein
VPSFASAEPCAAGVVDERARIHAAWLGINQSRSAPERATPSPAQVDRNGTKIPLTAPAGALARGAPGEPATAPRCRSVTHCRRSLSYTPRDLGPVRSDTASQSGLRPCMSDAGGSIHVRCAWTVRRAWTTRLGDGLREARSAGAGDPCANPRTWSRKPTMLLRAGDRRRRLARVTRPHHARRRG